MRRPGRLPGIMRASKPTNRLDRRACLLIIPIPAAAHAAAPAALTSDQCRSLLEDLAQLADPRQRRGRRHALVGVLGVAVSAVDGLEFNLLGLNFGVSPSGVKLPIVGRIGSTHAAPSPVAEEPGPKGSASSGTL